MRHFFSTRVRVVLILALLITVIAFNMVGDGLRDALDPKLKH